MRAIVDALGAQHAELAGLLAGLGEPGWRRATPCEGWDVADVVLHLAQSDELALASARGRFDHVVESLGGGPSASVASVDAGVDRLVARERGLASDAVHARWVEASGSLRVELEAIDPHERVRWVAGDMAARTLATTRLAETWIHTRDVAIALDVDLVPTSRLWHVARLAWRTIPHAFTREGRPVPGPVAFHLTAPDGTTWDFSPEEPAATVVTGPALDLCLVAARRLAPEATSLHGEGSDAEAVLSLVRTWA